MIICEGIDGSGKSNLARELCRTLDIPMHPRMSTSIGGPVDDLFNVASRDVMTLDDQPFSVYDRHALISEYVYGPIVRGTLPLPFTQSTAQRRIQTLARQSLVVWCRPPFGVVQHNIRADRDMAGVSDNIPALYAMYDTIRTYWPGESVIYDYTNPRDLEKVLVRATEHQVKFESNTYGSYTNG